MRVCRLLVMTIIIFLLCGCQQNKQVNETMKYTDEQLSEIAGFIGTKKELRQSYHTNSVLKWTLYDNNDYVVYWGNTKALVLLFDVWGNKVYQEYQTITIEKDAFDKLSVGSSLSEVLEIDPKGEYIFMYAGRNDYPKYSTHYTTDHFIIRIRYDANEVITKINIV